ncbi:MAG: bifunctional methylenetetrahydrofolate dehydrogenase/methenyltetrahydrofolate cyclohydrolase FolD [Alphaproteobacteria bacterium]|nr:bifunctional methylenetetrahydrofolate dehydrogenase/methenyltetrahydrofolate cyclohydrolase FolD [Alphaproteobacteria bacterium]TAD90405.1 MAG: bifunctional methylenetetrahydrofolate dehydrogenase/methenyltetrahydrofolate cyclohydrolase FolD [Alphaproteobacteria bacterium]
MATRIDGKALAAVVREQITQATTTLTQTAGVRPSLHVVLVGDDPASRVYVSAKEKQATAAGFISYVHRLPVETSPAALLALVAELNLDPAVDGILVQLPLPPGHDTQAVVDAIDPAKDVDGFHPVNAGLLALGRARLVPCTPQGSLLLVRQTGLDLSGQHAVVLGRSQIVGRPMAALLLQSDCTVTIAHSRTRDLPDVCRTADILVAAVGRAEMVRGSWVKSGAVVIDVGINRLTDGRLVGDVATAECEHAAAITPVPGGVGPMTIACLLRNTVIAACDRRGLTLPAPLTA